MDTSISNFSHAENQMSERERADKLEKEKKELERELEVSTLLHLPLTHPCAQCLYTCTVNIHVHITVYKMM